MEQQSIIAALNHLVDGDQLLTSIFSRYLSKQVWSREDSLAVISKLSDLLWNERYTVKTAELFSPILLEILTKASNFSDDSADCYARHEWLCICLSKLIWRYPEVGRFTRMYFEKTRSLFWRYECEDQPPATKKTKTEAVAPSSSQLMKAAYVFLIYDTSYFKDLSSWSVIVPFLKDSDAKARWFAYHCLARVGNIKDFKLSELLEQNFTQEELIECAKEEFELSSLWNNKSYDPTRKEIYNSNQLKKSTFDLATHTVNVCGVLLSKVQGSRTIPTLKMVSVPSTDETLYLLALAVSSAEPVLLQGPVGCGKTSLVEHLALMTGRRSVENFVKIQLGDHVDSKMLLGAHICTEIPGQFVWKPGILVKAMTQGHWLLLEDIDCAPMDVVSLLVPVLQSRSIVLPGHSYPIKASPDFQLFATRRLLSGVGGSFVEFSNNAEVITKEWRKVMVNPLSKTELTQVISTKWPVLQPIISRILTIYSQFSADSNGSSEVSRRIDEQELLNTYNRHGRLTSMRDLFKFCDRITENFDSKKSETAINVLKNAMDCFCDSIPTLKARIAAAEYICEQFNIPSTKAEYFCKLYKPEIENSDPVILGRIRLPKKQREMSITRPHRSTFARTRQAGILLEKVAACIVHKEPVLLVGETGTGKTSIVQHLAEITHHKLTVINMSQQSDSVDLVGGYKPIDFMFTIQPIKEEFDSLFPTAVDVQKNSRFLQHISNCFVKGRYNELFALMLHAQKNIVDLFAKKRVSSGKQMEMVVQWKKLGERIGTLKKQLKQSRSTVAFKFMEGSLIKAMKNGEWLLLDEINLAEAETLECLAGVLEKDDNAMILLEKGESEPVEKHPDFHVFACMNPATDVGKKDLPTGIRSRFTEFFVEEVSDKTDLMILVHEYLLGLSVNNSIIEKVVNFYNHIKVAAVKDLSDGCGYHPHYSLRTLCRALKYASKNPCHNVPRSLYEAFCLSFLSQLDNASHVYVTKAIIEHLLSNKSSVLKQSIPEPRNGRYVQIAGYWLLQGKQNPCEPDNYIFTETVRRNLHDLARIVSAGRFPVLLQGETSSGKTSLIQYLAKVTGNVCVRVNNHEHTDIQEYIGTYTANEKGNLVFREGILVEAMKNGYWIILDELNLAPTEVMEALNRVLDDNRELYITETREVVKAKSGFMVFATQNPAGLYGGRKILSRAFRNRFIELHFNEIPPEELEVILAQRCKLSPSFAKKLVSVMDELQLRRRESGVFAGKQGFITLRDLFRWGERYHSIEETASFYDWHQHIADEGYLLLAGRVRFEEEALVIQEVIEKHMKRKVDPKSLFTLSENTSATTKYILQKILDTPLTGPFKNIVWTENMRRLAVLVGKAMQFNEPVLLIGNTGCGKTSMCQIYAHIFETMLHSVNCHMNSESADFLGGLRPVRDIRDRKSKLFEWVDGPLIKAMHEGSFFLCDEISLADDSVLERLNSVLEPEQKILLTEKSFDNDMNFEVTAKKGFHFFATMNPGGDYGKKELSPALRNRFTEIWCPNNIATRSDVIDIVEHNLREDLRQQKSKGSVFKFGCAIADFLAFYSQTAFGRLTSITLRDVLTWVEFINIVCNNTLSPVDAYLHGAFLVFLDSIGSGQTAIGNANLLKDLKEDCFKFLGQQVGSIGLTTISLLAPEMTKRFMDFNIGIPDSKEWFGIGPFHIELGCYLHDFDPQSYVLQARTTRANALRLLRAMQLSKPILLEGSPGVGKTSLVDALAKASGHGLVRINLSEQTDISDLFGADLPVEGGDTGEFAWRDGPLLQALRQGHWVLLDELNLASQSVLEGLNAVLDHRSEAYISELGITISLNRSTTRIFGCQNPHRQGGSRKGLPRSFLNRFTQVYVRPMDSNDLLSIAKDMYSGIPDHLLFAMIKFNAEIQSQVNEKRLWGRQGSPFEFNLRDIFRWCEAIISSQSEGDFNIGEYVKLIYADRMRTPADKNQVYRIYEQVINECELDIEHHVLSRPLDLDVYEDSIQLGHSSIKCVGRNIANTDKMSIAPGQLPVLESLMKCIEMNWMPILVGSSGSGKSSLVRLIAELSGHRLHVMSVNSEMDTMELLGGFEQVDLNRKVESVVQDLEPIIQQAILQCIQPSIIADQANRLSDILANMHLLSSVKGNSSFKIKLRCLINLINALDDLLVSDEEIEDGQDKESHVRDVLSHCNQIVKSLCEKVNAGTASTGGQFEWVDSILIDAAQRGHWLLIDDANFCSSSVLDRLNGLLEQNGVLTVSEQGVVKNELRTIRPHRDFRIFLTMNPRNGEISRAMRNRGVEISVEPVSSDAVMWRRLLDIAMFTECKGLNHSIIISQLYALHNYFVQDDKFESPLLSDYLSVVSLCAQFLQRHDDPKTAFFKACFSVYVKNNFNSTAKKGIMDVINVAVQKFPPLGLDLSLPVTSLFPTTFDYRQSSAFSSVKKHVAVFTYFISHLRSYIRMQEEGADGHETYFPYPAPGLPRTSSILKRFFCIMRIMIESCSVQLHKFLGVWLQTALKQEIKLETGAALKSRLQLCLELAERLSEQLNEDIVLELIHVVSEVSQYAGFQEVKESEITFDPRWKPSVYRRLLFQLKQNSDNKHHSPPDCEMIDYKVSSCANKFSLLLLLRTLEFDINSNPKSRDLCSLRQTEKVSQCLVKKGKRVEVVSRIPAFLECIPGFLFFMLKKGWDCTDESYWKFREILYSFYACQQICEESIDSSGIEYQLIVFNAHFYWLWKKVKHFYDSEEDVPSALQNAFIMMDECLQHKSTELMFRQKFVKKNNYPVGFSHEKAAELCYKALDLYQHVSLLACLNKNELNLNHLKVILSNRNWITILSEQVYQSVFGSSLENPDYLLGLNKVEDIKLQLHDANLIGTENDDIMEVCQNPAKTLAISNKKMAAEIQLLPLLDYIFNIYTSEILHPSPLTIDTKALYKMGIENIYVRPNHLAHVFRYHTQATECKISSLHELFVLLMTSFLNHVRHGFSSEGLQFLHWQLVEDGDSPKVASQAIEWKTDSIWSKQAPLLTYICTSICDKSSDTALVCQSPLRQYEEKVEQLEFTKGILWSNFEKLASSQLSIRSTMARVITSWFFNLISGIAVTEDVHLTDDLFTIEYLKTLFSKAGLASLIVTKEGINVLSLAFNSVRELNAELKDPGEAAVMWLSSKAYIYVGLLTTLLLVPRDAIDPALKRNIKAQALDNKLQDLLTEIGIRDWVSKTTSGFSYDEVASLDCTPYLKSLQKVSANTKTKLFALNKKLVCREKIDKFEMLKEIVKNYLSDIGSPDTIIEVVSHIDQLYHSSTLEKKLMDSEVIQKAQTLVASQRSFVEALSKKYCFYYDLTMPFLLGVEQMMHGIQLAKQSVLLKEMDQQFQTRHFHGITDFLSHFISFPIEYQRSPLDIACLLLNGDNIDSFKNLLSLSGVTSAVAGKLICKLLKSAILEIVNEIKMRPLNNNGTTNTILTLLSSALGFFWNIWNLQEIQIKEEKEAEESLYVHKTKHHEGELTEEEALEKKLLSTFPSFGSVFADCGSSETTVEEGQLPIAEGLHLTLNDAFEVWQLHATVMSVMLPNELKNSDENMKWVINEPESLDCSTPYLLRYEVVCEIVKSLTDKLDGALDSKLVAGHLLMCHELQKIPHVENQFYDIYHDPNPTEVLTLNPILDKLGNHLKVLLIKYPEEPQLLQILKLVNRILSFPVTDPLMKFVVGMELILESMQTWRDILKIEKEELTKKIIQYRSLELDGWRKGLDCVIRKQYVYCSKWWFHLFNLFSAPIKHPESGDTYDAVINALKQFLDESPLGEFPARLSILHTFLQQSKLSKSIPAYRKLAELLFNLYNYYEQFLPDINNRLSQIRKPIDKELKDYVKIARWQDTNFDALKQSVKKSHRFVVKHVKAFEDALKMPAKNVFTIPSKKDSESGDGSVWALDIRERDFMPTSNELVKEKLFKEKDETLFQKMPHYHKRMRKITKKMAKAFPVANHINTLNEFCGTVIEALESVTLDSGKKMCTRSQEKKQALMLIQKKKQMLSTLFKNLKVIGLSYRHGMIFAKNRNENFLLTVPAFETDQMEMLKLDVTFKELLLKTTQDTSHYFYKSIAQYALLQKYMQLPNKELTLDVIHRIQGYSANLLYHVASQRETIVQVAKRIDQMGCFLGTLSTIPKMGTKENIVTLPPESEVLQQEDLLNSLMVRFMTTVSQFGALMNCAPKSFKSSLGEIPCINEDAGLLCSLKKDDFAWNKITRSVNECVTALERCFQQLSNSNQSSSMFATWERFSQTLNNFKVLASIVDTAMGFVQEPNYNRNQQLTKSLSRLSAKVHKECMKALQRGSVIQRKAKVDKSLRNSAENNAVATIIQKLMKKVLLSYQDIIALCVSSKEKNASEDNMCPDNLFTEKISSYLLDLENRLRFREILKLMLRLKKRIQRSLASKEDFKAIDDSLRLLINLTPVLNQYFQLIKVYFASVLGMHRTSCKFLTILLEIFNILATKGFCIPADLQEEAEKSGGTKFEDIEAGGLDEGEGTKDVSETIETEDQLEDTFKEGQEKKEKEDQGDVKDEEKGIEMSEDFEGKSYNPEKGLDESDVSGDEEEESPDLDKKMGEVDVDDAEKLDDKVWGSDSEDEDQELNDDNGTGGVTENQPSELVAKDGKEKEMDSDSKNKQEPVDTVPESQDDEYQGDVPDPMIDAPPDQEPEVVELPDDMEITDDMDKSAENEDVLEITQDPDEELESKDESEEMAEPEEACEDSGKAEEDAEGKEGIQNATSAEPASEDNAEDKQNESNLPTHTPTTEADALAAADHAKSSSEDPVQEEAAMDWENGGQNSDEQHREGQAESRNLSDQSSAHEGRKSSAKQMSSDDQKHKPKLRPPGENRTLDESADDSNAKQRPVTDKKSLQKTLGSEDPEDIADMYEHVSNKEEGVSQAVDVATEEQAAMRPAHAQDDAASDSEEVIELSSDDEEDYCGKDESAKTQGDTANRDQRRKAGEQGEYEEDDQMDVTPEGEVIRTQSVARGDTTIHTQHDLWASMSLKNIQERRYAMEKHLEVFSHTGNEASADATHLWRNYEDLSASLSQELCEQLRLVLEPTKMSKLKGDYRTGKRLNMRKIIAYIASQFRKDKIWLRRTKPNKRQYQIMLAVDDSSSMSDNHSKQLAFESLAVLGQSLSLLEAGELSVVSFGEKVELVLGFNEQFNTNTGARMFQHFTFSQTKTSYVKLLKYATETMVQARNTCAMISKETAQLLLILSDGRGIFFEGKVAVENALRQARDNNIFMVFIIIDSPTSQNSILDLKSPIFDGTSKVAFRQYIQDFPFPFYIILRDVSALPSVLGGALRQWFELVTATDR